MSQWDILCECPSVVFYVECHSMVFNVECHSMIFYVNVTVWYAM
jgi:hypothetical protein